MPVKGHFVTSSMIVSPSGEPALCSPAVSFPYSNVSNQVKLTLVIAAISYSDDRNYPATAALFRCPGSAQPLRTRGSCLCHHAAGFVDADQGTGAGVGGRPHRARHRSEERR